ncbi:MAG TPA: efflux transporter periplasmic adaptor subunit, partial [Alphaproteobacteria bacterium]|nr:efflux transporter periplasmic adaptor subunit [Alphaproteobacteria bacterium]
MTKRMIIMLVIVGLVAAGVIKFKMFVGGMMKQSIAASFSAPTVSTIKADLGDWQPKLEAVGTIRAINGADLSSELSGIVESINFTSDSDVKSGTPLVHLRAEDDIAKLNALQATAKLAEITFERDQKQLKAQAVSQAVVDTDIANLASASAQVSQQQAIVDKKIIRAP